MASILDFGGSYGENNQTKKIYLAKLIRAPKNIQVGAVDHIWAHVGHLSRLVLRAPEVLPENIVHLDLFICAYTRSV